MASRLPIYDVNSFVMSNLGTYLPANAKNGTPAIIPVQDIPEASGYPKSYIIYTVKTAPDPNEWWVMTDDVTYVIWNKDLGEIQDVSVQLTDLLRRMDETATDINDYLININKMDFTFHSFRITGVSFPVPTANEGGRLGQPFTFRYNYSINSGRGYSY